MDMFRYFKNSRIISGLFLAGLFIVSCSAFQQESRAQSTLKDAYEEYFLMGTALNASQIQGNSPKDIKLVKKHFNAITPENVMKWENIHPKPGEYDFELADQFVKFGEENDMFMTGHTLVWHSQTPDWVFTDENGDTLSREALLNRMKEHIQTVVGRYKDRVESWDVVNEAMLDSGSYRKSPWYKIIGKDYLIKAFEYTHKVDPDAELYYNDYSLELPAKREGTVQMLKYLKKNDAPITGVGTQGHFYLDWPELEEIEKTIDAFAKLDLDVMVTEVDIDVLPSAMEHMGADVSEDVELREELNPYPNALPDSMKQKLANRYADLFEVFISNKDKLSRVTFWGVTDANSWKNNWPVEGRTNYPLLFNRDWEPKSAYDAVIEKAREQ